MARNTSLLKILGALSLISFLTSAMMFFFYKGFNEYIDIIANEVLDLLAFWGVNLSIEQLWIVLGAILLVVIIALINKGD